MSPKELVQKWVDAFNREDVEALAGFYAEDAVNHQVANEPLVGRSAIRQMFAGEFAVADMTCIPENLFQDGEWAILEWKDPNGSFYTRIRLPPILYWIANILRPSLLNGA